MFVDKFKGLLALIIPYMWFILPLECDNGLTTGGELVNELNNVL